MLQTAFARLVDRARAYGAAVIIFFTVLTFISGFFAFKHFSINTDVTNLIDPGIPWRQREIAFSKAFPQRDDILAILVDGTDSAGASIAAQRLKDAADSRKDLFIESSRPEANSYFARHGLMLLPEKDLIEAGENLIKSQPMLGALAHDMSLRGLFGLMEMMLKGLGARQTSEAELKPLISRVTKALGLALENPADEEAWNYLMEPEKPGKFELRRFVLARSKLDFSALSPGGAADEFIRNTVKEQKLEEKYGVRVRLTGPVALADEEFASISEGMAEAMGATIVLILIILYLALQSWRFIVPIFAVLTAGLIITLAFALLLLGSLNLISVAFAVMFTGIAVDFGIQFGVRLRDVRLSYLDLAKALPETGKIIAQPLALAALTTAAGFFSFGPTSYRGVAELGIIAGAGMLIALFLNVTLLPAILRFTNPPAEKDSIGFRWAAPLDTVLVQYRKRILTLFTVAFAAAAIATLFALRFDFDPINLKDPKTESVATLLELVKDPDTTPYTIDVLAENSDKAEELAERLRQLPEVDKALTLLSLVPEQQDEKIPIIQDTANLLAATLKPSESLPPPSPAEEKQAVARLRAKLLSISGLAGDVQALSLLLEQLEKSPDTDVATLQKSFIKKTGAMLAMLKEQLSAKKVDFTEIPSDLRHEWVAPDGQARIEVYPKGDARDQKILRNFNNTVKRIAPQATGMPISIQESAATIQRAFIEAGFYTLIAISLMLYASLRNVRDTFFVLLPLILAACLTLGTASLINLPINFANIIALPLLFGLGASFAIYFVVYWRDGQSNPLQSAMARAVLFSASTAVVAFGSLSFSKHMGTASMGLLLVLSLFYVLFTTLFFLPALLGKSLKSNAK